jgi:hypothetical protein
MYTIRELDLTTDESELRDMFTDYAISKLISFSEDTFQSFKNFYKNKNTIVGAFLDNELVAILGYCKWKPIPNYFINSIMFKQNFFDSKVLDERNPLPLLLNYALTIFEDSKCYDWFMSRPVLYGTRLDILENCEKGYDSITDQSRYDWYIDEKIETGSRSKYPAFDTINFSRDAVVDLNIFRFSLKPQYRSFGDVIAEEFKHFNNE